MSSTENTELIAKGSLCTPRAVAPAWTLCEPWNEHTFVTAQEGMAEPQRALADALEARPVFRLSLLQLWVQGPTPGFLFLME